MLRTRLVRLAIFLSPALYGTAEAARVQHAELLRDFRVGADAGSTKPAAAGPTKLSFNAFSRDFALELEPNGRLAGLQAQLRLAAGTSAYRGNVAGRPGSWARIVLSPAGPTGIVFDGETLYGIESGDDRSAGGNGDTPTMFRLADVYFAPNELGCEIGAATIDAEHAVAAMAQEFTALAAAGATLNLNLGAVADYEFSQAFGAAAETALLTRFNNVDGIFSQQLGIQVTVADVDIFTASDDPFTTTTASALLDELADYRADTPSQDAQGLTHMFTGRDLDGSTVGIAFGGAVCAQRTVFDSRSFGAGLSEARRGAVIDSLVAAHEMGHNFGAPHDGDSNGSCAATATTFLMAPSINGSNQFSTCSVQQMQAEIASASCLTRIGPANVTVVLTQPQPALASVAFDHTATVLNEGADPTTGVTFNATTEQGLEIVAASASGATCSVAPAAASCALGSLGPGASRTVTLRLRPPRADTFTLTGTVAAAADADSTDNRASVAVTANPAVDLAWLGTAAGVQLNAQTTINATLDNAADYAAGSVVVSASMSAGLRPDQATLSGASCTVAGQAITCPTRSLIARGTASLVVTATGTAAGNQQIVISATTSATDLNNGNNQLTLGVAVNAPAESGGGGGALSWWTVVALLAAGGWRLRASLPERRRRT